MSAAPLRIHAASPGPAPTDDQSAGERLIDRAEFQQLLGFSRSCFARWLAMGRLPEPIRLSRTCHRWRWSEVQKWVADGCPDPRQNNTRR
jgi:predicted DNA-binding transcriptional regulator AlpA